MALSDGADTELSDRRVRAASHEAKSSESAGEMTRRTPFLLLLGKIPTWSE